MAGLVRLTEASLRQLMRDDRYWNAWHPERRDFNDWVGRGWQALTASRTRMADGTAVVHVRAYERTRNGVVEKVGAHTRSASDGGGGTGEGGIAPPGDDDLETPAGRRGRGRGVPDGGSPRPPDGRRGGGTDGVDRGPQPLTILPSWMTGRGGRGAAGRPVVPGRLQERIPGLSGKEKADDVPSWVAGQRPYVNETPEDFARRMMNGRYPEGWYKGRDSTGQTSEFSQIRKYARGFRNPTE